MVFAHVLVMAALVAVVAACGGAAPEPTPTPAPTAVPAPTPSMSVEEAMAAGYTREEEPCANLDLFPELYGGAWIEELEDGMCAFYYPPGDGVGE